MEKSINETLLFRFLDKETSEEENEVILQWVSDSEDNRTEFQRIHQAYHLSKLRSLKSEIDVDEAWTKLNSILPKIRTEKKLILPIFYGKWQPQFCLLWPEALAVYG